MSLKAIAKKEKRLGDLDDLSEYLRSQNHYLTLNDFSDITVKLTDNLRAEFSETGDGFLFDANTGKIFSLNITASFIFAKMTVGLPLSDVIKQLVLDFHVEESYAISDLQDFIYRLRELGIGIKE